MTRRNCVLVLASLALMALSTPVRAQTVEYFGSFDAYSDWGNALDQNTSPFSVGFAELNGTHNGILGTEFQAQFGIPITIVQRDGFPMNIVNPGVTTSADFFAPGPFSTGNSFFNLVISSTAINGAQSNMARSDNFDFIFHDAPTAASLWIGNIGPNSPTEVQFLAANGSIIASEIFDTSHFGIEGNLANGNNRIFYGITTTIPIARIRTIEPGGDADGVCYDEVTWGQAAAGNGDTTPPTVTITTPLAGAITSGSIFVSADVMDASQTTVTSSPAGILDTLPPGGGTATGTVSLPLEGDNIVTVTATDSFGNVGGSSVLVVRDSIAPAIVITSPLEGAVLATASVIVVVSIADATATQVDIQGTASSVPAGGGTASSSVNLVEGTNTISVTATDAAGNQSSATRVVYYDASAPLVSISSPADGATFGPGEANVTVVALVTDQSSTHVVSSPSGIDAMLPAGGGAVTGTVTLVEGLNTIAVSATDVVDQVGSAFVSVLLDTTPPLVTLESPTGGSNLRGTIDLHADAHDVLPGTGVTKVDFLVDGGLYASLTDEPYEIAFDTTALADGSHTFTAVATDGKGNTGSASATARVDNTAPTIAITDPADGALVGGSRSFTATASDAGSGVDILTMRANGAPPATDGSFDFDPPAASGTRTSVVATQSFPDGSLVLTATVTDAAGNEATASITVIVDNTAPQKMLITPTDGAIVSGPLLIQATASDPNLATLTLFLNGVPFMTTSTGSLTTTVQTTSIPDGPLEVKIVALDLAGNFSTCVATVTVNNMAFKLNPQTLNLKSKGGANSVTAEVTGPNASLLIPTEAKAVELRVPGGSPVPSTQGWAGDDHVTSGPGGIPMLSIKFDRQALITAIRAGIAGGSIPAAGPVTVTLVSAGRVIGTDSVAIVGQ